MPSPNPLGLPHVATILAAGKGSRMRNATSGPKCLLRLKDRTILDEVLMRLPPGVTDAIVVISAEGDAIAHHLAVNYSDPPVAIHVVRQSGPSGTMSALTAARPLLERLVDT